MAKLDLEAFCFDPEIGYYESSVEVGGARIAVRVAAEVFDDKPRAGALLDEVIGVVERERERVLGQVVEELLEDKNDGWLRDGEAPLSEQDFRRKLALEAIAIGPGGEIELSLDDDGMFWGHLIVVKLDSAYRLVRVDLEG